MRHLFPILILLLVTAMGSGADGLDSPRERILMDAGWRFAFGNATDPGKDFDADPAGQGFSYFAKTGAGAGAAAMDFNDDDWRELELPHDWAVEAPFSERGSGSHGYKAIGKNFPERSIGWYRKTFFIPPPTWAAI
jgi:beta-galactosidase